MSNPVPYHDMAGAMWRMWKRDDGTFSMESVGAFLLMDIREELKRLNSLLHCQNFIAIPRKLDRIGRNTEKRNKKKPKRKS